MGIGIGIGIGNTMWRRGGGVNWSSYWTTREDSAYPNLFIDVGLATGDNDGSTWANAFQTFDAFYAAYNNANNYDVYIKVQDTPTRISIKHGALAGKRLIFNATGVGTEVSTRRGVYFGSDQIDISGATLVSGTLYKIAYAGNAVLEANDGASKYGVWVCSNPSAANEFYYDTIVMLKGASTYDNAHVVSGRYFYDDVNNELYFNIGRAITAADYVEVMKQSCVVETCDFNDLYGGIFRFGNMGHDNGTCSGWKVFYCDFSYNALIGFDTAADPDDGNGDVSIIEACTIKNNGYTGINANGNCEKLKVRFCAIIDNVTRGYVNSSVASDDGNLITNCVIAGSVIGATIGQGTEVSKTTLYNNIFWNNTTDLDIIDHANVTAIYDYNLVNTFAGKAAAQANDLTADPEIDADGLIGSGSVAANKGKTDVYSEMCHDLALYQATKADGTIYKQMNLGAYMKLV